MELQRVLRHSPVIPVLWAKVIGFLFMSLLSTASCNKEEVRNFTTVLNPGCSGPAPACYNLTLIHIRSDGKEDSLHFLWSFIGAPTLLMARTPLNSNLKVDWGDVVNNYAPSNVTFQPPSYYDFGWALDKVLVADDVKDVVNLDKINGTIKEYPTKNFTWDRLKDAYHVNTSHVRFTILAKQYNNNGTNQTLGPDGYFKFTVRMQNTVGYSDVLPYMIYSGNNTQIDIAFNDVQLNTTEADYPGHPRIGFNFLVVQNVINSSEEMRIDRTKTLDDEHTPGVFETFALRTPILNKREQSFIQWKPICYTAENRDVEDSVDVWAYPFQGFLKNHTEGDSSDLHDSILWAYYGEDVEDILFESFRISFGTYKDGFYNKTKHISWTYSTGYGSPPKDYVSTLVLLVVGIGLGIPALTIVLSVSYVMVKKLKQPRDDLLLPQ